MNIGIDARLYGLEHTGIGRYVMQLIKHLASIDSKNKYTLFVRSKTAPRVPKASNFKTIAADIQHYTLSEQLKFSSIINSQKLDLVHFPHFNTPFLTRTPFVVTIHDLLWHEVKGYSVTTLNPLMYTFKYLGYKAIVSQSVNKSQHIITPSKWIKNKVTDRFQVDPGKITVTYEGVDRVYSKTPRALKADLNIKSPFIVYTGSLYPHKNVNTLIKALAKINRASRKKISLVIVSARNIFTDKTRALASKMGQKQHVIFTNFLPDDDLRNLYSKARALIQPSTSEGFGLTGLEAMAAGLPVISSNAASLPEIYEEAALFFNPQKSDELVSHIQSLIKKPELAKQLKRAGYKQVKQYSFKKMARQTLKVYENSYRLRQNK